jgi:hypothetical protein
MFEKIILRKELISYLEERNLSKQYQKAKENILA